MMPMIVVVLCCVALLCGSATAAPTIAVNASKIASEDWVNVCVFVFGVCVCVFVFVVVFVFVFVVVFVFVFVFVVVVVFLCLCLLASPRVNVIICWCWHCWQQFGFQFVVPDNLLCVVCLLLTHS